MTFLGKDTCGLKIPNERSSGALLFEKPRVASWSCNVTMGA